MPIFVIVMHALCNACWDRVLSRAAMLIKHVLCLVLPTDTIVYLLHHFNGYTNYFKHNCILFCVPRLPR